MTHRHIVTITFGTCLVTHTHTHMHAHILTLARALWGCPPFKRWLGGGGGIFAFVTHFSGGALRTTLGGGGGVELKGLGGCSFPCFTGGFFIGFYGYSTNGLQFQVAGMPCNAMQCCGVLWSRKV